MRDPEFQQHAYATYARLREEGPISKVSFLTRRNQDMTEEQREQVNFFGGESYLVTHFDEGTAAMLDPDAPESSRVAHLREAADRLSALIAN
mgnify:CR=1 FL=1